MRCGHAGAETPRALSEAWKQARWQAGGTGAGEAAWREAKNIPNLNDLLASLGCRAT